MRIMNRQGKALAADLLLYTLSVDGMALLSASGTHEVIEQLAPILSVYQHPHARCDGWTIIQTRRNGSSTAMAGFTRSSLSPHTDSGFLPNPPTILCLLLLTAASSGGDALLVDTAPVLRRYSSVELARLRDEVWIADRAGTNRQPALSATRALHVSRYRDDQIGQPRADSELARQFLNELAHAIAAPLRMPLRPGQGYVVDNHRVLHGRTAFIGDRRVARLLAFIRGGVPYSWLNQGFSLDLPSQSRGCA